MTAPPIDGRNGQWVWLAQIRRTQGRTGEVFAEILTDFPEKFAQRKHLWLLHDSASGTVISPPRQVELNAHWLHKGGVVLHFAAVDSISSAELLIGQIVAIPQEERAALGEDEVYIGDLIGCCLFDIAGATSIEVGTIADVDRTAGPVPLLVVDSSSGEVLIPFAKSYLRNIKLDEKRVEMALPEGLVDLNTAQKP